MACHGLLLQLCVCGSTNTKSLYWLKGVGGNSPNFLEQHLKANRCLLTAGGVVGLFDAEDCLGFVWLGGFNSFSCWFCQIPRRLEMEVTHSPVSEQSGEGNLLFLHLLSFLGTAPCAQMPGDNCTQTSVPAEMPLWHRAEPALPGKQGKMGETESGRKISEKNRSSIRESPLKFWGGKGLWRWRGWAVMWSLFKPTDIFLKITRRRGKTI